jgi:ankyrin repeat protein
MDPSWYEVEEFCAAAKRNDTATMTMILDMQGTFIANSTDSAGDTALTWSAWYGNLDAMRLLLDYGADINMPGVRGKTAMGWAAEAGRKEAVALLLERGADASIKDDEGKTPLDIAREKGHKDVADLIDGKRIAKETALRQKQDEEEGKALTAKRLQELKKNRPPKIKGF